MFKILLKCLKWIRNTFHTIMWVLIFYRKIPFLKNFSFSAKLLNNHILNKSAPNKYFALNKCFRSYFDIFKMRSLLSFSSDKRDCRQHNWNIRNISTVMEHSLFMHLVYSILLDLCAVLMLSKSERSRPECVIRFTLQLLTTTRYSTVCILATETGDRMPRLDWFRLHLLWHETRSKSSSSTSIQHALIIKATVRTTCT